MNEIKYFTKQGLQNLKDELNHLKNVERPNITKEIAEARDKGDLSENAEYDAAKEAQGMLEAKIAKLEEQLSQARVLDESELDTSSVHLLTKVIIKNTENDTELTYAIVPESEADLMAKKISVESPIAQGLLGKKVGEIAEIEVPSGIMKFEIIAITT
ncbi:MAG TPA: transcription elongation factor GreA [Flavobacteriales bacterium]|jgi:transcription elongation factor GreA|nr:transcription elongation factor GreA [Flavobacteriales bacterium]HIL66895.1 transcription elongation factor GreA [Flavobacteriales bacterium]|tara:strand:+ start:116 stop:589 length:474 start_codon:yes stop_codon:yes gene_type:complete